MQAQRSKQKAKKTKTETKTKTTKKKERGRTAKDRGRCSLHFSNPANSKKIVPKAMLLPPFIVLLLRLIRVSALWVASFSP
jgi:hypothetical protein